MAHSKAFFKEETNGKQNSDFLKILARKWHLKQKSMLILIDFLKNHFNILRVFEFQIHYVTFLYKIQHNFHPSCSPKKMWTNSLSQHFFYTESYSLSKEDVFCLIMLHL